VLLAGNLKGNNGVVSFTNRSYDDDNDNDVAGSAIRSVDSDGIVLPKSLLVQ
jgi:hypothetical protein